MVLEITYDEARRRSEAAGAEVESLAVPQRERAAAATAARARLESNQAAVRTLEGVVAQASGAQRELAAAEARQSSAAQAAQLARSANDAAARNLEAAQVRVVQTEADRAQVPALQQQAAAAEAEAANLSQRIADLELEMADFEMEGPYGKPRPGTSIKLAQIRALNVQLNAARARATGAHNRLAAIGNADAAVQAAHAAMQQAATALNAAGLRLGDAQREEAAAAQVAAAARARVVELQGSAGALLRGQVAAADAEVARLDAQLADVATRIRNHVPPTRPRIPDWKLPLNWEPEPLPDLVLDQLLATQADLSAARASAAARAAELRRQLNTLLGPEAQLTAARADVAAAEAALAAAEAALREADERLRAATERCDSSAAELARVSDAREVLAAGGPTARDIARATKAINEWTAAAKSSKTGSAEEAARREALLRELGDAALSVQVVACLGVAPAVPAVLLPVRLETRYDKGSSGTTDMVVRIYPDEIAVDTHEPGLTKDESAWGSRFWKEQARSDSDGLAAWSGLADRFGAGRAAWITRATAPGAGKPSDRDAAWTRAASVWALPDRWLVLAYRDGERVAWALSEQPVQRPLAVGPTPGAHRNGEATDDGMRWMVDIYEAYAKGMAARLPGVGTDVDRVVVLGIRPDDDGSKDLGRLLEAHRYTDGIELLAHGTATNSTKDDPTAWSSADPGHLRSHAREHGAVAAGHDDGSAGDRLARALGVPTALLSRVGGAGTRTDQLAAAMNAALWPATWGYLLDARLGLPDTTVAPVQEHFRAWVRARGPLPVLRLGRQPYGVLPAICLDRWEPAAGEDGLEVLTDLVARLRGTWAAAARAALQADDTGEGLLGRTPGAATARARGEFLVEERWFRDAMKFMDIDRGEIEQTMQINGRVIEVTRRSIGYSFPVSSETFHRPAPGQLGWPLAEGLHLADPQEGKAGQVPPDYIDWLATASSAQLDSEEDHDGRDTLLYLLLRQGRRLGDTAAAIGALREETADELARLMLDTLDLATHRLDAWATSLATRRLFAVRGAVGGEATPLRSKVTLGAYGWIEGPWPARDATEVPAKERPGKEPAGLLVDQLSAGYLHAPSVPQAVTSAVLRSAQLGRRTPDADPLAIDLSSRRVRLAQDLLDGVRQGQSLGALLGYRLERTLRETGQHRLVSALRELAPLDRVTAGSDGAAAAEVDGLMLLRARRAGALPFQGTGRRTAPWDTAAAVRAAEDALAMLEDALDSVDDATLAEAVHHTLQGNYQRASANLVARSGGDVAPPELEFVRTPRTGVGLTHRVAVLTPARKAGAGWAAARPRVKAEPRLAVWAEALLGPSNGVSITVEARDAAVGTPIELPADLRELRLSALGLAALDLLALAEQPAELDRLVAAHVLDPSRRPASVPSDAMVRAVPDAPPAPGAKLGLTELLAVARAGARLLGISRPLDGADLALAGSDAAPGVDLKELRRRVDAAVKELERVLGSLDSALGPQPEQPAATPKVARPARCRTALEAAWAAGVAGAVPEPGDDTTVAGRTALARSAVAVRAELVRRIQAARALLASDGADEAAALVKAMKAVFGESFTVLPLFRPADPGALARAVAGTDAATDDPGQEPDAWFAKVAQVREAIAALESVALASEALGTGVPLDLRVGQLPLSAGGKQRWAGLPLEKAADAANKLSLVLVGGAAPADRGPAASTLAGLLVDEWVESIPQPRETTAVTFHYEAPGSQAPQVVLVAVPPRADQKAWDITDLEATVLETIELVQARTADLADLDAYAASAPADSVDGARLTARRGLLPAVMVPTPAADERLGVDVGRLAAVPPDYGVVESEDAPLITGLTVDEVTDPPITQGQSPLVVVTGSRLDGGEFLLHPSDGVTLVVESVNAASARVRLAVGPDAPIGERRLHVRKAVGGEASHPLRIVARPRVDGMSPALLHQSTLPASPTLTFTGHHLAGATLVRIEGGPGLTAVVEATTETTATLRVTIPGSRQPITTSDWDPTERGGPLKPPRRVSARSLRDDVPVRFVLRTAGRAGQPAVEVTASLTVSELHWVTDE